MIETLSNGLAGATDTLVLAHGAGASMDSPFMEAMAEGISAAGVRVVRFEFPYMAGRRSGKRRPPDREPVLLQTWRDVAAQLGGGGRLVIGGKSMGGRMASMVADELGARGLVCLGYPFHAPGRPQMPRIGHLQQLRTPAIILQGTRDSFGKPGEIESYGLPASVRFHWLEDGDHDFKPRAASGRTQRQNRDEAIAAVVDFIQSLRP
jgi:uncharacterized protein